MDRWLASKPSTQNKVTPTQTTRGHKSLRANENYPSPSLYIMSQPSARLHDDGKRLSGGNGGCAYGAAAFATHFLEKHTKLNQDEASKKRRKSPNRSRPSQQRHQERFSANFAPDSDEIAKERNDRPAPAANSFENQSGPRTWACALSFQAMAEFAGMITTVWKQLSIDHWKRVAFAKKYSKGQPCCAKNEGPPLKNNTTHQ